MMKFPLLLASLAALAAPVRAGTVAAAEAGEVSLVPRIGGFTAPSLTAASFSPALTPGLAPILAAPGLAAPGLAAPAIALIPVLSPAPALAAVKPVPAAEPPPLPGAIKALVPSPSAMKTKDGPGSTITDKEGAELFDGVLRGANLKDALSFPRGAGPDGMITVSYGRPDWSLKMPPAAYESFSEAAAEHRAAVRDGAPAGDQMSLGLKVAAAYSATMQGAGVKVLPTYVNGRDGVGSVGILILPDAKGHRLNRVAARLAAAGVKMVFSPRLTATNPARFELTNSEAFLFLPNLDLGFPGEVLRHELRHFGFFKGLLRGQISLLHAYFTPKPGRLTADDARAYGEYLALEEVATYAHQVRGLLRLVAQDPTPEGLKELKEQLAVLREVARIARGLIAEAKAESAAGTAVLSASPIGEKSSFLNVELSRGRLAFGASPSEVAGEAAMADALARRLRAWELLLDGLEPAAASLEARLHGEPDWAARRRDADALLAAITRGEAAWR